MLKQRVGEFLARYPRWLVITVAVFLGIVLLQFLYPGDRALPLTKLGGEMVGFSADRDIASKLEREYEKTSITTHVRDKTKKTTLAEAGLSTDNKAIIKDLADYAWYWRVVPLSIFFKGASVSRAVTVTTDEDRFASYAAERAKECLVLPKNAGVKVENGDIKLDPAVDGQECSLDGLRKQLKSVALTKQGMDVKLHTTAVKPERSDKDVQPLLAEAKKVAERKLTVVVAGRSYAIDKPTLASWLAFPEDAATKKITVGVNDEVVKAYLNSIQKDTYVAPGVTVVTTHDSIETGRVPGTSGRGIDMTATAGAIHKQVLAGSGTVNATMAVLSPTLRYNRSYSKTPAGLQALVNDIARDKGDFGIAVRKLGDSGVHANGDKQYRTASTYKMYVAYSVLRRIDAGQMNWNETASGGQTVSQCFDKMIVNSDNPCAEYFGDRIGWGTVTNEVRALGLARTNLNATVPLTTANDAALFLQKLESNQLSVSEPSRARLLDAMKRQVFRQGIPAGVGVPVADKVGFIEGYLHDAAIVYSPSGVYVLTIFSNNSSWAQVADAARQIHAQLQ